MIEELKKKTFTFTIFDNNRIIYTFSKNMKSTQQDVFNVKSLQIYLAKNE